MNLTIITPIITLIGVPIIRGIAGWVENSLADGKIDSFEWAKLGETIVRIGVIGTGAYFGLAGMGINISALAASSSAVVLDFILSAIKKKKK